MAKMGVELIGPDDPWTYAPTQIGTTYISCPVAQSVQWFDGTAHPITSDVRMWGTFKDNPNLGGGMIHVLFITKGDVTVYATTIDNVPLDTLVGGDTWAILGWADVYKVHDWQQY